MTFNKSKTNKNKLFLVFYKVNCKIKSRSKFIKSIKKIVKEYLFKKLDLDKPLKIIKAK